MRNTICLVSITMAFLQLTITAKSFSYTKAYEEGILKAKEIFSIGGDTNDSEEMLLLPSRIRVNEKGELFILDRDEHCIKKYDKDGKFIKKFGRYGQGPGEFERCSNIEIAPNGNIITYDINIFRFTIFTPDGEYVRSIKFPQVVYKFRATKFGYYIETHNKPRGNGTIGDTLILTQYNWNFKKQKVIFKHFINSGKNLVTKYYRDGKKRFLNHSIPNPYHDKTYWDVIKGCNIVQAITDGYRIRIFTPNGKLIREVKHSGEKVRITQKMIQEYLDNLYHWSSVDGESGGASKFLRENMKFPEHKPYFKRLNIDGEGNILLTLYGKEGDYFLVDVFNYKGEFINQVKIDEELFNYGTILNKNGLFRNYGGDNRFGEVKKFKLVN